VLAEQAKHAAYVKAGDIIADFQVPEVDGALLSLRMLLTSGPEWLTKATPGDRVPCARN